VLGLSADAGKKLLRFLCQEKQDLSEVNTKDPSSGFVYGDPTGRFKAETQTLKGGVFCTIFNPTKVQIEKDSTYVAGAYASGGPSVIPYEVAVSKTYLGPNGSIPASMNAAQVENIFVKQGHLFREPSVDSETDHILHEPGIEEQCVLLARAFRVVPKLLRACWMSMPSYLEYDSVKAVLNARTTAVVDVPVEVEEDEDESPKAKKKKKSTDKPVVASKSKGRHDDDDDDEEDFDDDEIDEDDLDEDSDEEDTDDSDDDLEDEEADDEDDEDDEDSDDEDEDDESDDEDDDDEDSEDDDDEDSDDEDDEDSDDEDEESDDEDDDSEDDDDDESDEDEEDESSDFGDDDEVEPEVEDKLNRSMAHAKGMERSKKRVSKPVQPTKAQPLKKESKPAKASKPVKASKPAKPAGKGSSKVGGKNVDKPSAGGKPGRKKKPGK